MRETAVFGGIPIAEKALEERACGVWVVNINTGEIVGSSYELPDFALADVPDELK